MPRDEERPRAQYGASLADYVTGEEPMRPLASSGIPRSDSSLLEDAAGYALGGIFEDPTSFSGQGRRRIANALDFINDQTFFSLAHDPRYAPAPALTEAEELEIFKWKHGNQGPIIRKEQAVERRVGAKLFQLQASEGDLVDDVTSIEKSIAHKAMMQQAEDTVALGAQAPPEEMEWARGFLRDAALEQQNTIDKAEKARAATALGPEDYAQRVRELKDRGFADEAIADIMHNGQWNTSWVDNAFLDRLQDEQDIALAEGDMLKAMKLKDTRVSLLKQGLTLDPNLRAGDVLWDQIAQNVGQDGGPTKAFAIGGINAMLSSVRAIHRLAGTLPPGSVDRDILERMSAGAMAYNPVAASTGEILGGIADPVFLAFDVALAGLPVSKAARAAFLERQVAKGVPRAVASQQAKTLTAETLATYGIQNGLMRKWGLSSEMAETTAKMIWNGASGAVAGAGTAALQVAPEDMTAGEKAVAILQGAGAGAAGAGFFGAGINASEFFVRGAAKQIRRLQGRLHPDMPGPVSKAFENALDYGENGLMGQEIVPRVEAAINEITLAKKAMGKMPTEQEIGLILNEKGIDLSEFTSLKRETPDQVRQAITELDQALMDPGLPQGQRAGLQRQWERAQRLLSDAGEPRFDPRVKVYDATPDVLDASQPGDVLVGPDGERRRIKEIRHGEAGTRTSGRDSSSTQAGAPRAKEPWEMTKEEFTVYHNERAKKHAEAQKKADVAKKVFGPEDPRTIALQRDATRLQPASDITQIARRDAVHRAHQMGKIDSHPDYPELQPREGFSTGTPDAGEAYTTRAGEVYTTREGKEGAGLPATPTRMDQLQGYKVEHHGPRAKNAEAQIAEQLRQAIPDETIVPRLTELEAKARQEGGLEGNDLSDWRDYQEIAIERGLEIPEALRRPPAKVEGPISNFRISRWESRKAVELRRILRRSQQPKKGIRGREQAAPPANATREEIIQQVQGLRKGDKLSKEKLDTFTALMDAAAARDIAAGKVKNADEWYSQRFAQFKRGGKPGEGALFQEKDGPVPIEEVLAQVFKDHPTTAEAVRSIMETNPGNYVLRDVPLDKFDLKEIAGRGEADGVSAEKIARYASVEGSKAPPAIAIGGFTPGKLFVADGRHRVLAEGLRAKRAGRPGTVKAYVPEKWAAENLPQPAPKKPETAAVWYSKLREVVDQKMGGIMDAAQLRKMLENNGVKPEELEWSGLEQLKGKVTKGEVLEHLTENAIEVTETMRGGPKPENAGGLPEGWRLQRYGGEPGTSWEVLDEKGAFVSQSRYEDGAIMDARAKAKIRGLKIPDQYKPALFPEGSMGDQELVLPGGQNYRELLLTLPETQRPPNVDKFRIALTSKLKEAGYADDVAGAIVSDVAKEVTGYSEPDSLSSIESAKRLMGEQWFKDFEAAATWEAPRKYRSGHFPEENILAHIRFTERVDAAGKKTLFLEEVQSDWHQAGRRRGYEGKLVPTTAAKKGDGSDAWIVRSAEGTYIGEVYSSEAKTAQEAVDVVARQIREDPQYYVGVGVPDAPFKKTWPALAMKRMIRYAAENGFDRVGWTTGKTQAARYKLSRVVKDISWNTGRPIYGDAPTDGEARFVRIFTTERETIKLQLDDGGIVRNATGHMATTFKDQNIVDIVGKDVASKIMADRVGNVSGSGLEVGDSAMAGFYDGILVKETAKIIKKYGATVEQSGIPQKPKPVDFEDWISGREDSARAWVEHYGSIDAAKAEAQANIKMLKQELNMLKETFPAAPPDYAAFTEHQTNIAAYESILKDIEAYTPPPDDILATHSFDITDAMREDAMTKGMPLFQRKTNEIAASVEFLEADQRAIVRAFEAADISSMVHELGHVFRRHLDTADMAIAEKWAGAVNGTWSRTAEEKFSRGFERYLRDGNAPIPALKRIFEQFKAWLTSIYHSVSRGPLNVAIPPEMRGVYDRIFKAPDAKAAVKGPDAVKVLAKQLEPGPRIVSDAPAGYVSRGTFKSQKTAEGFYSTAGPDAVIHQTREGGRTVYRVLTPPEGSQSGQPVQGAGTAPPAPPFSSGTQPAKAPAQPNGQPRSSPGSAGVDGPETQPGLQGGEASPQGTPIGTRTRMSRGERVGDKPPPPVQAPIEGREALVELPDRKDPLKGRFAVVSAGETIASHDARHNFEPMQFGDKNERPYGDPTEGKALRESVYLKRDQFKPAFVLADTPTAIDGPPIVNRDIVVLGGNARTMVQQLIYHEGGERAQFLRDAVVEAAAKFGIDAEAVRGVKDPMVVRIIDEAGEPGELSRALNKPFTAARTSDTDAVSRGAKLGDNHVKAIARLLGSDKTLGDVFNDRASSDQILSQLIQSGAFDQADLVGLVDQRGLLTQEGRRTVERTLLGAAIPDVRRMAETTPGTRGTLIRALPAIVKLRAKPDMAFDKILGDTLDILRDYRESEARSLEDLITQGSMMPQEWRTNKRALALASAWLQDTPTQLYKKLAEVAGVDDEGSIGLFGKIETRGFDSVFKWEGPDAGGGSSLFGTLAEIPVEKTDNPNKKPPRVKASGEFFGKVEKAMADRGFAFTEPGEDGALAYGTKSFPTFRRGDVQVGVSSSAIYWRQDRGAVYGAGSSWDRMGETALTVDAIVTAEGARKKGLATQAMRDLISVADENGVSLFLEPVNIKPFTGRTGMKSDRLAKWYKKLGFTRLHPETDAILVRRPAGASEMLADRVYPSSKPPPFPPGYTPPPAPKPPKPKPPAGSSPYTPNTIRINGVPHGAVAFRDALRPVAMPELLRIVRALGTDVSIIKSDDYRGAFFPDPTKYRIELNRDIFDNPEAAAKTFAHELGHMIDFLDDKAMARGNVLARALSLKPLLANLKTMRAFTKDTHVASAFSDPELRQELIDLAKWWKPYDPALVPPAYVKYRESAVELYADALSVFLSSPGTFQERAPKFAQVFLENLNRKPTVLKAYNDIQDILAGKPEDLLAARRADINEDFAKGVEVWKARGEERNQTQAPMQYVRQALWDSAAPIVDREKAAALQGIGSAQRKAATYALEEFYLRDNAAAQTIGRVQREVYEPLKAMDITKETAGEYLMMVRIADGDRQAFANPRAHTPETAKEMIDGLEREMGPAKFATFTSLIERWHDIVFGVVEEAVDEGVYGRAEFTNKLEPNRKTYATFAVIDHLEDIIPESIMEQVGTFKGIANPWDATMMKTVSLHRAIELNKAKRKVLVDGLKTWFPMEVVEHKSFPGGPDPKAREGKDMVLYMVDGKPRFLEVDRYVAKVFKSQDVGVLARMGKMLGSATYGLFHPFWIGYNWSFAVANLVRDFNRSYRNLGALAGREGFKAPTMLELAKAYWETAKPAARQAWGNKYDPLIDQMMENRALGAPFTKYDPGEDVGYDRFVRQYGLDGGEEKGAILGALSNIAKGIGFVPSWTEVIPKTAAYKVLMDRGVGKSRRSFIVRNYVGTPNTRRRGLATSVTNSVFMYSNVAIQGMRADAELGFDPKTAGGFWLRSMLIDVMPKLAMKAAGLGLFGMAIQKMMELIPEYEKSKYIIVPMGTFVDQDGKTKVRFMRIPHTDTGRGPMSILWALMDGDTNEAFKNLWGELPFSDLSPAIDIPRQWITYASGANPYDSFRARNIIGDQAWKAGGKYAAEDMTSWTFNQFGALSVVLHAAIGEPGRDRELTTTERILGSIPGFERFVKVSDRGVSEKEWEAVELEERERARFKLRLPDNARNRTSERYRLQRLRSALEADFSKEDAKRLGRLNAWYRDIYLPLCDAIEMAEQKGNTDRAQKAREQLRVLTERFRQ